MQYLDLARLEATPSDAFRNQSPYPWTTIDHPLTADGFETLYQALPDVSMFERVVGARRGYGQAPHDRCILHYGEGLDIARPWKEFIAELRGEAYDRFLHRLLGLPASKKFILTLEWYYAWQGCSVSPHCDARRKIATHIFYFAKEADWDPSWGGHILMLDDKGRYSAHSAPTFDDLEVAATLDARGNSSLIFERTEHSWHGVRPIGSPDPSIYRKLFVVTVNVPTWQVYWRRLRGRDPDGYKFRK